MRNARLGTSSSFLTLLTVALALAALAPPARADFTKEASLAADSLVLKNLVGRIEVVGHAGPDYRVEVHVKGRDATPERVQVEVVEGSKAEVEVRFPLAESRRYVYPDLHGSVSFGIGEKSGWLDWILGRDSIKVSSRGPGLEIWADAKVFVPRGKGFALKHGVGAVSASDVEADLDLATASGPVEVSGVTGSLAVDTGSGEVTVERAQGDVNVGTGSGDVTIRTVRGKHLVVDTGSGRVELRDVEASAINVDTGSGGVEARGVGADDLRIDTGSGAVALELARMGKGGFEVDTGSGGIEVRLPTDASAEIRADTGSGEVRLDLAGDVRVRHKEEGEAELTVGAGAASVRLDSGSGSLRIWQ